MDKIMADVMILVAKKYTNSTGSMFDSHFWYVTLLKTNQMN